MSTKPELKFRVGKKVSLRLLEEDDVPLLAKWINDEEVTQYVSSCLPHTIAEEIEWLSKLSSKKPNDFVFGLETAEGLLIGTMGLHRINYVDRTAGTGAMIGEKEYWGKGYGSEAKMLLLKYAFDTLNLRKICASVIAFNERSLAYQIKCGYKIEGRRKDQMFRNGQYFDEILVAVFREDWLPIWERYQKTGKV